MEKVYDEVADIFYFLSRLSQLYNYHQHLNVNSPKTLKDTRLTSSEDQIKRRMKYEFPA